jgi:sugar phosphate isomerase/epimerase
MKLACHTSANALADRFKEILATCELFECKYVSFMYGPCESVDQILQDAERYEKLGAQCRERGLTLCYHNHDHELRRFDGKHGLDILMENTAPKHLQGHFDVAWLTFGGVQPAEFIRKYEGRCPLLHMKDLVRLEPGCETASGDRKQAQFTEVGTGIVDVTGVVEAAREIGTEWLSVEQDRMRQLSRIESLAVSVANLRSVLYG